MAILAARGLLQRVWDLIGTWQKGGVLHPASTAGPTELLGAALDRLREAGNHEEAVVGWCGLGEAVGLIDRAVAECGGVWDA